MGNYSSLHSRWFKVSICRKTSLDHREQGLNSLMETDNINSSSTHVGIKTVGVGKACSFSTESVLCLCIVTWNMNGKEISSDNLAELVGSNRQFDLFVVGLQEVPRLSVARLLQVALIKTHSLLAEATMQSLQLFVFGSRNPELNIKEVNVDKHAVGGCGGLIGRKKGAVAISINLNGIHIAFVSCHLSAHAHKVEERNSQCKHISHSLLSKERNTYARPFHITVWLGDLNYRIHGIDTQPARHLIHKNLHNFLTRKDQLLQEAKRGQVFNGYCEGTLTFKPTYKYNVGTSNYDTGYKVRVPSWTDRILFKIESSSTIEATLHSYESIDSIESSDHKPVKAHLCLKVNSVSSQK